VAVSNHGKFKWLALLSEPSAPLTLN